MIVRIGDTAVTGSADVVAAIQETLPGDSVGFEIVRGEERLTLDVTIGERPEGT